MSWKFGSGKILDLKNFDSKSLFVQENFESKEILGPEKMWVQKKV